MAPFLKFIKVSEMYKNAIINEQNVHLTLLFQVHVCWNILKF